MPKYPQFTVIVGMPYTGFSFEEWTIIAVISSEGLMQLLAPKFKEIYHNQPIKIVPGKLTKVPENIKELKELF